MSSSYLYLLPQIYLFQVDIVIAVQYRCYRFVRLRHLVLDLSPHNLYVCSYPFLMDRLDKGEQMSIESATMATLPKAAYFEFEEPFHRLVMVRDKKRKGKRLLACLEDNWTLTVT